MQVKTWKLTPQMMAAAWEHLKRVAPIQGNNPSLNNSINRIDFQLPAPAGFFVGSIKKRSGQCGRCFSMVRLSVRPTL